MKTQNLLIVLILVNIAFCDVITTTQQPSVGLAYPQTPLVQAPFIDIYSVKKVMGVDYQSDIKVQIRGQQVTVRGCNIHISQYRYFGDLSDFFGFDPFISTRRACPNDKDSDIVGQLQISSSKAQIDNHLYFYDFMGEELLALKKQDNTEGLIEPTLVSLDGKYQLNVESNPTLIIDGGILQIKGCNSHTFQFRIVDNILQLGPGASTRIACPIDNDNFYISTLQRAVSMKKNAENNYEFSDERGNIILRAIANGNEYDLKFPSLSLHVSEGNFQIEGCNSHKFNYQAYEGGKISFGPSASTEKACIGDYDHVFLSSILMAARFEIDNEEDILYFSTIEGKKLNYAVKFVKKQVKFDSGRFTMEVLSSSLPPIIVEVDSETLTMKGCGTYTVNYKAYNDGDFTFTLKSSTMNNCPVNNDPKYISALLSGKSYELTESNQFIMKNEEGRIIINFIPEQKVQIPIPVNQRIYQGTYNIRLSGQSRINPDILIQLSPIYVKIIGCNLHSAEYDLYKDGGFKLKQVASTKRFCPNDQDSKFLQAFIDATKLGTSKNGLVLSNDQGDLAFLTDVQAKATSAERYYYTLEESYRQFEGRYIVRAEDEVIPLIKDFVIENYDHFLDQSRIVAGFRWYLLYNIRYEVIFRSIGGTDTFNVIMDYNPETKELKLQSLVLMDFTVLPISSQNCAEMDKSRCKVCNKGYGLFRGRCHKEDPSCLLYDPEQCFKCADGYNLVKGKCRKNN